MDVQAILELMKEMKASGIETLEWQADGQNLRLVRPLPPVAAAPAAAAAPAPAFTAASEDDVADAAPAEGARPQGRLITSPVVGIFYAASAPDQDAFVSLGSPVDAGTPLGIIEAMKLMNEIESDADGVVKAILVENGQPVEFDQPLFVVG